MSSLNEVIAFLDHLGNKGIVPKNTALSRKSAAKKFFDILEGEEQDVSFVAENFDRLYERFKNKNAMNFKGNSLDTYRSRVKGVLDDYFQWKADPVAWERSLNNRPNRAESKIKTKPAAKTKQELHVEPESGHTQSSTRKLAFPLGPSTEVKVEIPMNGLTTAELHRLGMFLFPYCNDISTERWEGTNWPVIPPAQRTQ